MGRVVTRRFRPTRPPGRSGPLDRTAGGIGGAAPASLDLYGQSRMRCLKECRIAGRSLCPQVNELCSLLTSGYSFGSRREPGADEEMLDNEEAKISLAEVLLSKQAVLMCGAGSSKLAKYPLWEELLLGMAAKCSPQLSRLPKESVLEFAQRIKLSLESDDYFNLLETTFEPKVSANYDEVHLALVRLGFCGLVTTNYDEVLECAVREAFRTSDGPKTCSALDLCNERTFKVLRFLRGLSKPSEHRFVLHLHGIHSAPHHMILTSLDYADKYGEQTPYDDKGKPIGRSLDTIHRKVLWTLLATHPLVFVGFSMEDAFFNYILKVVQADFQSGTTPIHFAIFGQKQGEDITAKTDVLRRNGVQPIYYPVPPPQGIGDSSGYSIGLRKLVFELADKVGVSIGSPGSIEITKRMLEL